MGGILSVCMRDDNELMLAGVNYNRIELGCCEIERRNTAATTSREECQQLADGSQHRNKIVAFHFCKGHVKVL